MMYVCAGRAGACGNAGERRCVSIYLSPLLPLLRKGNLDDRHLDDGQMTDTPRARRLPATKDFCVRGQSSAGGYGELPKRRQALSIVALELSSQRGVPTMPAGASAALPRGRHAALAPYTKTFFFVTGR